MSKINFLVQFMLYNIGSLIGHIFIIPISFPGYLTGLVLICFLYWILQVLLKDYEK